MTTYFYQIASDISIDDVMATLDLSLIGVQSVHGESRARLDARFAADHEAKTIEIDASTAVGQAFNDLFVGYLVREFGLMSFTVERRTGLMMKSPSD